LFGIPPEQASESVISQILNASRNKEDILAILNGLGSKELIVDTLERTLERLEFEEILAEPEDQIPLIAATCRYC
jgi:hypothetical protein